MLSFADRRYLITGVLNEQSIAWHVAAALQGLGAEVLLSSFGRAMRVTAMASELLPRRASVVQLDVRDDAGFAGLADSVRSELGGLDGVLHSVASADLQTLGGSFLKAPIDVVTSGFATSVASLPRLLESLMPLLGVASAGASVVGITVDSRRALPGYDWMGVYKSALESAARYCALYAGPAAVRTNLVASGPLATLSASAVPSFEQLADYYERYAPLGWDRKVPEPVVHAVLFLLSDWSRYITGQVLHVDGGTHAVVGGIDFPQEMAPALLPGATSVDSLSGHGVDLSHRE